MCEYSEKLVAWIDGELSAEDASLLEQHLHGCRECLRLIAAYKEVSAALVDYCDSVVPVSPARRKGWKVLAGAGAVAAALLLLSIFPRSPRSQVPAVPSPEISTPSALASVQTPAAERSLPNAVPRRQVRRPAGATVLQPEPHGPVELAGSENTVRPFPEIEIAIPAEAIFPPGAAPQGVQFVAAVSIGADGAPQSIRLRPY